MHPKEKEAKAFLEFLTPLTMKRGLNLPAPGDNKGEKIRRTFFCGRVGRNSLTRVEDSQKRKMNLQVRAKLRRSF